MEFIDKRQSFGESEEALCRTLSKNVKRRRRAEGFSKVSFSLTAGISRPTLDAVESGAGDPKLSTLCRISAALGVSLDELLLEASLGGQGENARRGPHAGDGSFRGRGRW